MWGFIHSMPGLNTLNKSCAESTEPQYSVKVANDLESQAQGHSYWIGVFPLPWYIFDVNLVTVH